MGFIKFSELAHDLENILSRIRDKELTINSDVMDIILNGCDVLEDGLELINSERSEDLDTHEILKKIHNLNPSQEVAVTVKISEKMELDESQKTRIKKAEKSGKNIWRIVVVFEKKNPLKLAKALVLLRDVMQVATLVKSNPEEPLLRSGKFDSEIEILVETEKSQDEIKAVVNAISGIDRVEVLLPDEKYKSHIDEKQEEHKEKEEDKSNIISKHGKETAKQIQSVRVDMDQLDKLMNLVGELLISKIRIDDVSRRYEIKELKGLLAGLDRLTMDIQSEVMQIRMIPIGNIFNRLPRMVRDLAKKEEKQVELQIIGSEIEFDRTILDEIGDPLVHMLRNSVDHGIEKPEDREKHSKEVVGIIQLIARREKNNAVIEVIDDGAGIDPERIKKSSIKKGLLSEEEAAKMSDNELQRLVFRPGISTNEVVTDVSGRGVGMDVVESKVKSLGGAVRLDSEIGKGTKITLELPLTIAIISVLLVKVAKDTFAIPLSSVDQTVDVHQKDIKTIKGNEVFVLRNSEIPLIRISQVFGMPSEQKMKYTVVVVMKGEQKIGLVVDSIISQQQILIKSLDRMLKGTKGIAGATIMGSGKVALIIDIASLLE